MTSLDLVYRFRELNLRTVPGNVLIELESYLRDGNDVPFLDANSFLDVFTISTQKNSLPASGFQSFLEIQIQNAIRAKYTQSTLGGSIQSGRRIVGNLTTTEDLVVGMSVSGTGIPQDSTLLSIRDSKSVEISANATATGTPGDLVFGINNWNVDYSDIAYLVSVVDLTML